MKKKIVVFIVMSAILVLLPQGLVFANDEGGETAYRLDPTTQTSRALEYKNTWAGYKLFQSKCKSCHFRGNDQGVRFLDTDSRTMRGWNAVFFKKNVRCARDGSWTGLSPDDLLLINLSLQQGLRYLGSQVQQELRLIGFGCPRSGGDSNQILLKFQLSGRPFL